jgi:hypothetical protein
VTDSHPNEKSESFEARHPKGANAPKKPRHPLEDSGALGVTAGRPPLFSYDRRAVLASHRAPGYGSSAMPAKSQSQQRFFGLLHAIQTGKVKAPSADLARKAQEISKQDVTDFAATKHEGLPTKVAGFTSMLGKGLGALNRGARFAAKVPTGQAFFSSPGQSAARVTKMLFNPNLGRYGTAIKGTALTAALAPPVMAGYNGAQEVRQDVSKGLDNASAAGIPTDQLPAGEWAKQFVHNPIPWAWRAMTSTQKSPLESFADNQTWHTIKNKALQGLHNWMPFKGSLGDYASLATRPGVIAAREVADHAGWIPKPQAVDPMETMQQLLAALQTPAQ